MKYTHYETRFSSKDKGITHIDGCWADLVAVVMNKSNWHSFDTKSTEQYKQHKEQFDAMVFAEMEENKPRTADHVVAFYGIVLDIDKDATYDEVRHDLRKYEYVLYSSGSTGLKSGDHFRVILPLKHPMNKDEWKRYNTSLANRFSYSDECFKKGIQIQYLPVVNNAFEDQFIAEHNTGKYFDHLDTNDLPFFETPTIAQTCKNIEYSPAQFSDDEMAQLGQAIIEAKQSSLSHDQRWKLGCNLKLIGMLDFDIVQILDRCSQTGHTTSNTDLVKTLKTEFGHVESLYRYLPMGSRLRAVERRTVRSVVSAKVVKEQYCKEFTLGADQYVSDIFHEMDFSTGINLLISDVGTGKSTQFMQYSTETVYCEDTKTMVKRRKCTGVKDGYLFVAPLRSIVDQQNSTNKLDSTGIATWNQIKSIIDDPQKNIKYRKTTLVVDECHNLFSSFGYRANVVNDLIESFQYFKSVILMSGTVEASDFSFTFKKVYRVHKTQPCVKNFSTVFCSNLEASIVEFLNESKNKCIVLINDKAMCEVLRSKITRESLVIHADNKHLPDAQKIFTTRSLGKWDVLLGTDAICEGLSIEDELHAVDVVVLGQETPERLEQFCNRFRNISEHKNVWNFLYPRGIEEVESFDRVQVLADVKMLQSALQTVYDKLQSEFVKKSFRKTYKNDLRQDFLYMSGECFKVAYTNIDHQAYLNRVEQYCNNYSSVVGKLIEYGFVVFSPINTVGNTDTQNAVLASKKAQLEQEQQERNSALTRLEQDLENNSVQSDEHVPELYTITLNSVQKLVDKGLAVSERAKCVRGYINDEKYFVKCHADADSFSTGNPIRECIINELNGRTRLTKDELRKVADAVVQHALSQYVGNDLNLFLKTNSWGTLVNLESEVLKIRSDKAVKELLGKYIRLGKSVRVRVGGGVQKSVTEIEALSLTGLLFEKSKIQSLLGGVHVTGLNSLYIHNAKVHTPDDSAVNEPMPVLEIEKSSIQSLIAGGGHVTGLNILYNKQVKVPTPMNDPAVNEPSPVLEIEPQAVNYAVPEEDRRRALRLILKTRRA